MNHASFHAARLRPARSYGAEGDKSFTFVVTSDGEVYKQNTGWFGAGSQEYYLEYDARLGKTSSVSLSDVKGDAARIIDGKIIGSWDDYEQAKAYADRYIKSKGAAAAATPADPAKPADPFAPPPPPPAPAGSMSTGMLVGIIGGGVALMGGLLYLASRSATPPPPTAK